MLHGTPALQNYHRLVVERSKIGKEWKSKSSSSSSSSSTTSTHAKIGYRFIDEFDGTGKNMNRNEKKRLERQNYAYHTSEQELRDLFDILSNGTGFIDRRTLYHAVKKSKMPVTEHQIMSFYYRCDINEDGNIDFIEFCHFVREEEKAIKKLFDKLDIEDTGTLVFSDIKTNLKKYHSRSMNDELLDQWIESIMRTISHSHSHSNSNDNEIEITYDEFLRYAILSGTRNLTQISRILKTSYRFDLIEDIYIPFEEDIEDKFTTSEQSRALYKLITFISGVHAGVISRTLTAPLDRLKVLMQQYSRGSISNHAKNILAEGGVRSFWRGNLTNCIKMAPETAIKFFTYENFHRYLNESPNSILPHNRRHGVLSNFIAGAAAGVVTQSTIYPLEVAKTRLVLSRKGQYRNFLHCLRNAARYEGFGALYQGWQASVGGIVPYAAIEMGVFFTLRV